VTERTTDRPRGRDEVRAAILRAARRRFASQGPSASTRDIAADANVNLGLLHRHFGTKDDLIRAVFTDAASRGHAVAEEAATFEEALNRTFTDTFDRDDTYVRMLAGVLLAGRHPKELQDAFPTMSRLIELGGLESRARILVTMLMAFGWQVFADFLVDALGYDSREAAAVDLKKTLAELSREA
jgi:AcrR family transcriptional regulator